MADPTKPIQFMGKNLSTLREEYLQLDSQVKSIATAIDNAGEDYDWNTLPLDGADAAEKVAAWQGLIQKHKLAKASFDHVNDLETARTDGMRKAAAAMDSEGYRGRGSSELSDAVKGLMDAAAKGEFGSRVIPATAMKALFTSGGSVRQNNALAMNDSLAGVPIANGAIVLSRFNINPTAESTLTIQDITAPTTDQVDRGQSTVAESSMGATARQYPILAMVSGQPVGKLHLNDSGRLGDVISAMIDTQIMRDLAAACLSASTAATAIQGAAGMITTAEATGTGQYGGTRAATASDAILATLEEKVVQLGAAGSEVDTIFMRPSEFTKLRTAWKNLNYPISGISAMDGAAGVGYGSVFGAAVIPTLLVPANTILMGPFSMFAELAVRQDVMVTAYDQPLAANDQILIQGRMEAAHGLWQPNQAFFKYTAANLFTADS